MAANIFNVAGERVDSLSEFFRREQNSTWENILYDPISFKPTDRNPIVITEKKFFEVSLKDTDVERVRFVRCTFVRCLFIGASFVECEFIDCDFRDTNTSKIRIQRCLFDPFCFEGNFDLKNDTNIAIDLYHSLYRNASEEHQPTHAIESLYRMKKAESAHLDSQIKRGVINRRTFVKRKLAHLVSDFVSGYGLRILHVLRLLVIVVFGFSFLNYLFRNNIFPSIKRFPSLILYILHVLP